MEVAFVVDGDEDDVFLDGISDNVGPCDCVCIAFSLSEASEGAVESTLMVSMRWSLDVLNRHRCVA